MFLIIDERKKKFTWMKNWYGSHVSLRFQSGTFSPEIDVDIALWSTIINIKEEAR